MADKTGEGGGRRGGGYLFVGPTGAKGGPLNVTRVTNYYTIPVT